MSPQRAVPCVVMRGGTSKGLFFHGSNLPQDTHERDAFLLAAMGSPDERQIDGMGGAHPLTSKVAVVRPSTRPGIDVDYLFLQVWPDRPEVSSNQNCGNILAGVGPFAIEEGLVSPSGDVTPVTIWMENTSSVAVAYVPTPNGEVTYEGSTSIRGVPGTAAGIELEFRDIMGATCGLLLPTGQVRDTFDGVEVTCIDNGMPVVCLRASDLGITGYESPSEIEAMTEVCQRVESIRLQAGERMNLGDVTNNTVPKMSLLSPSRSGGAVNTRTFIPKRVHDAIGVLGAVSVATACKIPGSVAYDVAVNVTADTLSVEHPTGDFSVEVRIANAEGAITVERTALVRTARMLMRGEVIVPSSLGDHS